VFEDFFANDYKMYGAALIGLAIVARFALSRYMYLWVWAMLSLVTVMGIGLFIAGMSRLP
jgi:hypothetical protein